MEGKEEQEQSGMLNKYKNAGRRDEEEDEEEFAVLFNYAIHPS